MPAGIVKSFDAKNMRGVIVPDHDALARIPTLEPHHILTRDGVLIVGQRVVFNVSMLDGKPHAFQVRDGSYAHEV